MSDWREKIEARIADKRQRVICGCATCAERKREADDLQALLDRVKRHGEEEAIRMGGPRPISSIERGKLRESK